MEVLMTKTEDIHELKITLRSGGKDIHAERKPDTGAKIPLGKVRDDPLLMKTIRILINLLRDNRLKNRNELEILGTLLYATLFGISPEGLSYLPEGITEDEADFLQRIAWETVQEYLAERTK